MLHLRVRVCLPRLTRPTYVKLAFRTRVVVAADAAASSAAGVEVE